MSHLQKAQGFDRDRNFVQALRHSELALVKLKQLNDRPIEDIDDALNCKFLALNYMDRNREAMECATERYCLYLTCHTHPPAICASFDLIESCINNKEYEDAELYARTTWETITLSRDSHIPDNQLQWFTARAAYYLAYAMLRLAENGNVPPEANQTAGQEAIGLARRAMEINTQLHGLGNEEVINIVILLADALEYFNNVDDDEVLRLYEQSIATTARVQGSMSVNMGACEKNLGIAYYKRAKRAHAVNDLEREMANLNLALPHFREAVRIYRAINYVDRADGAARCVVEVERALQQCTNSRATAATEASRG